MYNIGINTYVRYNDLSGYKISSGILHINLTHTTVYEGVGEYIISPLFMFLNSVSNLIRVFQT